MSSLIGRARLYLQFSLSAAGGGEGQGEVVFPRLVNRLDRETSGVVLIAKNSEIAGELGKILENRAVEKEYLAIVHGHVAAEQGMIDAPLGKDERSKVAVKDCVCADGTPAQTKFFVEKKFVAPLTPLSEKRVADRSGEEKFSLLRIFPRTGRKHQIRIHLAHIGHPIVGDKLYGGDEDCYLALVENRLTAEQRAGLILENHALHAQAIKIQWRDKLREFSCEPEFWFRDFAGV
ncbi:MAG TPA: RNA pseudouridine synthase [Verrucomicrobiae bacterium]|nr:RNA pseudouridine synthase [Verrucomicrobiae bacterium]